jgi:hypothetical protein
MVVFDLVVVRFSCLADEQQEMVEFTCWCWWCLGRRSESQQQRSRPRGMIDIDVDIGYGILDF